MLKIAGAAFVILACGWYGITVSQKYAYRPRYLRTLNSALLMLEMEIIYASTLLPEALLRTGERTSQPVSDLFKKTCELMAGDCRYTTGKAWEKALYSTREQMHFTRADLEILNSFGTGLGISEKEEQVKNFRLVREQLVHQERCAEEERLKKERLWRTMGFLIGTTVALVLI